MSNNQRPPADSDLSAQDAEALVPIVERYQRIFQGSGHGLWELELDSNKLTWYGDFWRQLGYSDTDALQMNDGERLMDFIHPDDRENILLQVDIAISGRRPFDTVYRIMTNSGDYIWAHSTAVVSNDSEGKPKYLSGTNINITQLKETEEALRISEARHARIIDGSSDGIWEWNSEQNGFYFSDRCWEHLGFQRNEIILDEEYEYTEWRERIHPDDITLFNKAVKNHLTKNKPFDITYRMIHKYGSTVWIRARGQAHFNHENKPTRMSGTNMNITELKQTQEQLFLAKEEAETANNAKSDFLSSMSHELRTPLNAILGYTQLFDMDTELNDDQRENIDEIRKAGKHLLQLVNEILDLAKIESGQYSLSLEPVAPIRVIDECINLLSPLAETCGVSVIFETLSFEQTSVTADAVRLKQVILNLINNAIKYNDHGGKIVLTLSRECNNTLRISILDTGRGIDATRQREVFEPFNRLGAEDNYPEGSGVGLVITKRLVEMMKGSIGFESIPGTGSLFWVDLPLYTQLNTSNALLPEYQQPKSLHLNFSAAKNILYIEDNQSNARLLEQLLKKYPQLALTTHNEALTGIYHARTQQPDLIILDINLPDMDGFSALEILTNDPQTNAIPVIALTANAMPFDIKKGKAAGFYEYLTKPIDIAKLVFAINSLFSKQLENEQS